jgi:hypothetical protein
VVGIQIGFTLSQQPENYLALRLQNLGLCTMGYIVEALRETYAKLSTFA